jgi:hypothetical protein
MSVKALDWEGLSVLCVILIMVTPATAVPMGLQTQTFKLGLQAPAFFPSENSRDRVPVSNLVWEKSRVGEISCARLDLLVF